MKQKSRIKDLANSELSDLRGKLKELPRGGLASLSKSTGIDKSTLYRFRDGRVIGSDNFKVIEIAMRDKANFCRKNSKT